jgi:hypothetical protein
MKSQRKNHLSKVKMNGKKQKDDVYERGEH